MIEMLRISFVAAAVYAMFLPIALWLGSLYAPVRRPPGEAIETLLKISPSSGAIYHSHSMILAKRAEAGEQVMLYEDLTPLGPAKFVKFTEDPRSFVIFSASDNSDPRTNGRHYWLVLPY